MTLYYEDLEPGTSLTSPAHPVERGELVSCFLLRIGDNMESIARGINGALQLSKRGGGVALLLSNLRENVWRSLANAPALAGAPRTRIVEAEP